MLFYRGEYKTQMVLSPADINNIRTAYYACNIIKYYTTIHVQMLKNTDIILTFIKVFSLDDIIRLDLEYINSTAVDWFTAWMFFFYPALNPVSPTTLKPFLSANNVPKNTDFEGAYRMLRPWIGKTECISYVKLMQYNTLLIVFKKIVLYKNEIML